MSLISFLKRINQEFSTDVRGPIYKSYLRQRYEVLQLMIRGYFTPAEYYTYRFFEKNITYRDMLQFISNFTLLDVIIPALNLNTAMNIHENKWLFHRYYSNYKLPITDVYGFYSQYGGVCKDGTPLTCVSDLRKFFRKNQPRSLVVKPVGGWQGKGIFIIEKIEYYNNDRIDFITIGGKRFDFNFLANHIENIQLYRKNHGVLLEGKLEQHSFFEVINPSTINHIRLVTFLNNHNIPKVYFAGLRLGRKGSETANWEQGALSVSIDLETGELGRGLPKAKYGNQLLECHPDSGVRFTGLRIPFWHEILQVSERFARFTPEIRIVGWDVVLTPSGPVVIEGNPIFNLEGVQVHSNEKNRIQLIEDLRLMGIALPDEKKFTIHPGLLFKALKRWTGI
jgi:hypothetical protein